MISSGVRTNVLEDISAPMFRAYQTTHHNVEYRYVNFVRPVGPIHTLLRPTYSVHRLATVFCVTGTSVLLVGIATTVNCDAG